MSDLKVFTCSFCGKDIEPGTGIQYVKRDGSVLRFCSSKCRKSMLKLKRKPRKFKWTRFYEKAR
nr:50S ribosomal protein L24e [Candidatus Freyrarchaeum guaymaensis]